MSNPLSVDVTFFTVLGYPISYIEFVGTVLYVLSVWLIARRSILTWPVGIVSVLLYMALFYQIACIRTRSSRSTTSVRASTDGGSGRSPNPRDIPSRM